MEIRPSNLNKIPELMLEVFGPITYLVPESSGKLTPAMGSTFSIPAMRGLLCQPTCPRLLRRYPALAWPLLSSCRARCTYTFSVSMPKEKAASLRATEFRQVLLCPFMPGGPLSIRIPFHAPAGPRG